MPEGFPIDYARLPKFYGESLRLAQKWHDTHQVAFAMPLLPRFVLSAVRPSTPRVDEGAELGLRIHTHAQ